LTEVQGCASSRGGRRDKTGGAERVEQSGAAPTMDGVEQLSTAATQTELTMDALAKLEEKLFQLKIENRRLKQKGYDGAQASRKGKPTQTASASGSAAQPAGLPLGSIHIGTWKVVVQHARLEGYEYDRGRQHKSKHSN